MKAIIMAGGKGTRLAPYTAVLPKPLMPLNDMPILELILRQLKQYGITEVILAVNHLSHIIRAFFDDGSRLGIQISYCYEENPLGTAGPLGTALNDLSDHFLLLNGDLLCNLDYEDLIKAHYEKKGSATIATYQRELKSDFGILDLDVKPNEHLDMPDLMQMLLKNNHLVYCYPAQGLWLDIGRPDDYAKAQELFSEQREIFLSS